MLLKFITLRKDKIHLLTIKKVNLSRIDGNSTYNTQRIQLLITH